MRGKDLDELAEQFLPQVAHHELTIIRDNDAEYRHLRFKQPGTFNMYFDLITWPGHLCFTGDMGTYVFSRVRDMFEFFRSSELRINASYWSDKCIGRDRDGIQEWSPTKFREMATERVEEYFEGDPDRRDAAISELHDTVLAYEQEEWEAASAWMEFGHEGFQTEGEDLSTCYEYTFRYLWCCHALVWGIQQYDDARAARPHNRTCAHTADIGAHHE